MFILEYLHPININFFDMMHQHAVGFKSLKFHLHLWNKKSELIITILGHFQN